jgi:hypothetical protein
MALFLYSIVQSRFFTIIICTITQHYHADIIHFTFFLCKMAVRILHNHQKLSRQVKGFRPALFVGFKQAGCNSIIYKTVYAPLSKGLFAPLAHCFLYGLSQGFLRFTDPTH